MNMSMHDMNALLDTRMRDVNTGYAGKATGFAMYNNGKNPQFLLQGVDTTGRPISEWVDANDCEICTDSLANPC